MGNWFGGPPKTLEDQMDEIKLDIKIAVRGLERTKEDFEEKAQELIGKAKEVYQKGDKDAALLYLQHTVRYRCACKNFTKIQLDLESSELTLGVVAGQHAMQKSVQQVARVLSAMNARVTLVNTQEIMRRFEKEKYTMELKQEIASETMDNSMSAFDNEEQQKELLKQLMDEIGMDVELPPSSASASRTQNNNNNEDPEMQDLSRRISKLRGGNEEK